MLCLGERQRFMRRNASHLCAIDLKDGWKLHVFRGGANPPPLLARACALVDEHYGRAYGHIAQYLAEEDAAMVPELKVHFVLLDASGALVGHQLLYGDGPSRVPCEVLQPLVDQRRGSRHVFEVKRAVLLVKGTYRQLLVGIARYVLEQWGRVEHVPSDHLVIGYSIEPAVARYLLDCGFSLQVARGHESFIYYPTRSLIERYGACDRLARDDAFGSSLDRR